MIDIEMFTSNLLQFFKTERVRNLSVTCITDKIISVDKFDLKSFLCFVRNEVVTNIFFIISRTIEVAYVLSFLVQSKVARA